MDYKKLSDMSNTCRIIKEAVDFDFDKIGNIEVKRKSKYGQCENHYIRFNFGDEFIKDFKALIAAEYDRRQAELKSLMKEGIDL